MLKTVSTLKTLSEVVSSLVINKMLYCCSVWSNTSASNVKKLQSIENFACKIITKTWKNDHVTLLLRELDWLPVDKLLYFRDSVLTYKCLNNLAPDYLCNKFKKGHQFTTSRLAHITPFKYYFLKLQQVNDRSHLELSTHGTIYNKNLKDCYSLNTFKTPLKKHLLVIENS